jgi:hypothetical protein
VHRDIHLPGIVMRAQIKGDLCEIQSFASEQVLQAANCFMHCAFAEWLSEIQAQGSESRWVLGRVFESVDAHHVVVVIAANDEIHAHAVAHARRGYPNIGKITCAVEGAKAFAFFSKVEWLSDFDR